MEDNIYHFEIQENSKSFKSIPLYKALHVTVLSQQHTEKDQYFLLMLYTLLLKAFYFYYLQNTHTFIPLPHQLSKLSNDQKET